MGNEPPQSPGLQDSPSARGQAASSMCPWDAPHTTLPLQKQLSEGLKRASFCSVFGEARTGSLLGFKLVGGQSMEGLPDGQLHCIQCAVGFTMVQVCVLRALFEPINSAIMFS